MGDGQGSEAMSLKTVENWLKNVEEHYGSLDAFPDARTVRIMLGMVEKDGAFVDKLFADAKDDPEMLREYTECFDDDRKKISDLFNRLFGWLQARQLPR
jgi:hypothetical protein